MKVERIDHIHILVKDIKGAMSFFSDIMGTRFVGPLDMPRINAAFDSIGLELISPKSEESPFYQILEQEGEGLLSIGLKVPDLDEAIAELEARGLSIMLRANLPALKVAVFHPQGAYGVRLELLQYDSMQPAAIVNLINVGKISELPWFQG
ncbi:VOC family protein [Chloroflexota bacterium]